MPPAWACRAIGHGRLFGRIAGQKLAGTTELVQAWEPELMMSERAEFAGPIAAGVPEVELQWSVAELREYREAAAVELGGDLAVSGRATIPEPVAVLNPWPPSLRLAYAKHHQNLRYVPYHGDARVPGWLLEPRTGPASASCWAPSLQRSPPSLPPRSPCLIWRRSPADRAAGTA